MPLDRKSTMSDVLGQDSFIYRFKQPWTKPTMEMIAAINDCGCENFDVSHPLLPFLRAFAPSRESNAPIAE